MHPSEEEVFIAIIVRKQPPGLGRSGWDPFQWLRSSAKNLMPPDAKSLIYNLTRDLSNGCYSGVAKKDDRLGLAGDLRRPKPQGNNNGATSLWPRWVLTGLSFLCFIGSAYAFYLLAK